MARLKSCPNEALPRRSRPGAALKGASTGAGGERWQEGIDHIDQAACCPEGQRHIVFVAPGFSPAWPPSACRPRGEVLEAKSQADSDLGPSKTAKENCR